MPNPFGNLSTTKRLGLDAVKVMGMLGENAAKGGKVLGTNAVRAAGVLGENAAKGGKVLGRAALTTPGRTLLGGTGGYGLGYGAGALAEDQFPNFDGKIHDTTARTGAALGASLSSAWGRNQLHRLAGRAPDEKYRPIKDTAKLLFAPTYPIERLGEAGKGTIGRRVGNTLRAAPWAAGGVGLGIAGGSMASFYPDLMTQQAREMGVEDPKVLNRVWGHSFWNAPSVAYQMYAPEAMNHVTPQFIQDRGWRRDTSAVGDIHRQAYQKSIIPQTMYGFKRMRDNYPTVFGAIDYGRSVTPGGYLNQQSINALAKDKGPDVNAIMRKIMEENKENLLSNPDDTLNSPLLRGHAEVFSNPKVLADPGLQRWLGDKAINVTSHLPKAEDDFYRKFRYRHKDPEFDAYIHNDDKRLPGNIFANTSLNKKLLYTMQPDVADALRTGVRNEINRVAPGPYYAPNAVEMLNDEDAKAYAQKTYALPGTFAGLLGRQAVGKAMVPAINKLSPHINDKLPSIYPAITTSKPIQDAAQAGYKHWLDKTFPAPKEPLLVQGAQ